MGIPVSGKNLFPSNIQGLPTWYEIRVNKSGHTARALDYDLMVAMNARDLRRDVAEVPRGRLPALRLDLAARRRAARATTSPSSACRSRRCATRSSSDSRERILMKNIAYARRAGGAARHRHARSSTSCSRRSSPRRRRCASRTTSALELGYDYAMEHFELPAADPARDDGRHRRPHPDRRQHRDRARLRVRGRDGRRLVPDHAVDVGDGRVQGVLRAATAATRRPARTTTASCRPRTSWPRSAW